MLRPGPHPLTDAASGRISMPFLPTLAVVIALAVTSVFCPSSERAPAPVEAAAAPGPTAFAEPAAKSAAIPGPVRLPAALAFAEAFALAPPPGTDAVRTAIRAQPARRLVAVARRSCPGRGCPEIPRRAAPPIVGDPPAPGQADGVGEAAEDGFLPPLALPFAAAQASVARTLAPAARAVGRAADLVRGGGLAVKASVVLMADCLP